MVEVFIANESYLLREGIKVLIKNAKGLKVIGEASNIADLEKKMHKLQPQVLLIDYASDAFSTDDIGHLKNILPETKYLAITTLQPKKKMDMAIKSGVHGHLLNVCSAEEITEAIFATAKGEKFFCGIIMEQVTTDEIDAVTRENENVDSVKITSREREIVRLIAEGFINKEIGDRLFISTHTVMTHRKNIMSKLGINNTAGLVIYAVQEKLISADQFVFEAAID